MSDPRQRGDRDPTEPAETTPAEPPERPLLGRPPQADEPQRPYQAESVSQPPPGGTGAHANPVAPGMDPPHAPPMPATGAPRGPHGPGPDEAERRLAQLDWEHWRAADRRKVPFTYPNWRS